MLIGRIKQLLLFLLNDRSIRVINMLRYGVGVKRNMELAEVAMVNEDWDEAVKRWEGVVKKSANKPDVVVWVGLARSYRNSNDLEKAVDVIHKGLADHSNNVALNMELAEVAMVNEDWDEAVKRWEGVVKSLGSNVAAPIWERLARSYRYTGNIKEARASALKGLENYPKDAGLNTEKAKIVMELAEVAMVNEDWDEAVKRWKGAIKGLASYKDLYPARFNLSTHRRLANISKYKESINRYKKNKKKNPPKIAVFTAISGNYDSLKLPEHLDERFDYIVFTDKPLPDTGIYDIRPMPYIDADRTRSARYVKTHPHTLLEGYDMAIWVDANIMITGDISSILEEFVASNKPIGAIPHPLRENIYEEAEECIKRSKDEAEIVRSQVEYYRDESFNTQTLIESGFMIFNLKNEAIAPFCDFWWQQIDRFSKRDQLSLPFVIEQQGIDWHPITKRPKSIRDHELFVLVPHGFKSILYNRLLGEVADNIEDKSPNTIFLDKKEWQNGGHVKNAMRVETAKTDTAKENWKKAAKKWQAIISNAIGLEEVSEARFNLSTHRRLANISKYKESINRYKKNKKKNPPKIAVFTAISGNYDSLKLPEHLDERFDYIVFTDKPLPDTGIYDIRPMPYIDADRTRSARYVKTHPHTLLEGYDMAIWVDANIMITGDISSILEEFVASNKPIGAIPHPLRENIYEEAEECIKRSKDEAEIVRSQVEYYRDESFNTQTLIESGFMIFNLKNEAIAPFCDFWWQQIDRFSKRDQLSLPFVIEQQGIDWHPITKRPKSIRDHELFVLVPHGFKSILYNRLLGEVAETVNEPFGTEPFSNQKKKIIEQHLKRDLSYEVIVCVHNALDDVKTCLDSIERNRPLNNFRLIIVDDGSNRDTQLFLQGFTQTNSGWVKLLRNRRAKRYTKAANMGLKESVADFVVLLNSDTIVTSNWIEKMSHAVFSTPGAGIVGPLSSAASHQSIPNHNSTKDQTAINNLPKGFTAEDMNRKCEEWSPVDYTPLVPLIHGFCFGITREAIKKVGYFDTKNFPNGYGEENDYCFRATDAGIGLVIATNTYIYHAKSKSYISKERVKLMKKGSETLARLWSKERIRRAILSMQDNSQLQRLRGKAAELYDGLEEGKNHLSSVLREYYCYKKPNQSSKLRVDLVLRNGEIKPTSSAFIRLISPLTTPISKKKLSVHIFDGELYEPKPETDICIVQRTAVPTTAKAKELVETLQKNNTRLFIDTDDSFSSINKNHPDYQIQLMKIEALSLLIENAEKLFVSTQELAEAYKHPNIVIIKNSLDFRVWKKRIIESVPQNHPLQLLYMGTATHQEDFDLIYPVLDKLANKYPGSFELTIIGVGVGDKRKKWMNDITKEIPSSIYPEFVSWLQDQGPFDIGLSPLVNNEFNRAKSDIKILDYVATGAVPVASDIAPYRSTALGADILYLAKGLDSWTTLLEQFIKNPEKIREKRARLLPIAQSHIRKNRANKVASRQLLRELDN